MEVVMKWSWRGDGRSGIFCGRGDGGEWCRDPVIEPPQKNYERNEKERGVWCFDVAMFIVTWICFLGLGHFGLFGASDVTKIPPFCELTFSTFSAGSSHHDPSLWCFLNCEIFWTSLTKGSSLSFWLQTAAGSFFNYLALRWTQKSASEQ